ncbi:uncharacterized protein LOC131018804 [Salvia miltiorrhiza]|uniref:uncharacterized protein LOC131018804 n=1 Tax=Salvia miltiorrhiza TaxID=226208 RepID=UPI0025ABF0F0|nr:uncharacterized protein LOC131018804 [Salvia miltiorrhiza]
MTDQTSTPKLETHTPIEEHAADIYTRKVFLDVQIEITEACNRCRIKSMDIVDEENKYVVDDRSSGIFAVVHNMVADTITCYCKHFVKMGLVCRHMFVVMRNLGLKAIPEKYIVDRWRKDAGNSVLARDAAQPHNKPLISEAFRCIAIAEGNDSLTESLMAELKRWADSNDTHSTPSAPAKERMFQMFYGSKLPSEITIHPPDPVKTKGSGKRLKSTYEKELIKAKKPKRRCKKCGRLVRHDSRNCGKVAEEDSSDDD